jgi:hypothetical protein
MQHHRHRQHKEYFPKHNKHRIEQITGQQITTSPSLQQIITTTTQCITKIFLMTINKMGGYEHSLMGAHCCKLLPLMERLLAAMALKSSHPSLGACSLQCYVRWHIRLGTCPYSHDIHNSTSAIEHTLDTSMGIFRQRLDVHKDLGVLTYIL